MEELRDKNYPESLSSSCSRDESFLGAASEVSVAEGSEESGKSGAKQVGGVGCSKSGCLWSPSWSSLTP